jgi:methylglutaconyl-CoA hydratase
MTVSLNRKDAIATITLDRPEKHNAFDDAVIEKLAACFEQAGKDPAVRIIILQANGKHFSAGADLDWMRRMADMDWQQNRADALALAELMRTIDQNPKPVICRVQGAAYGGALGLICASDIAIAARGSRFCLSEVRLGILPAVISPYVVRAIGRRQAQRFFMTAEVIADEPAKQLGIIHELCAAEDIDSVIEKTCIALLDGAPGAQWRSRELVEKAAGPIDDALVEFTAELIANLRTESEGRDGLDAFLNKSTPGWRATR